MLAGGKLVQPLREVNLLLHIENELITTQIHLVLECAPRAWQASTAATMHLYSAIALPRSTPNAANIQSTCTPATSYQLMKSRSCKVAALWPVDRRSHHVRPYRIQNDVSGRLQK